MKIVFTGGGTAGHIFPIVAIVREMKKIRPNSDLKLFYIGPKHQQGAVWLTEEQIKIKTILGGKLRRYFSLKNFIDFFKIPIGILEALFWLFFLAPDFVFSKGGYGSSPVAFAAWVLGIPLFLHESDTVPGLASKIQSRWATEIFTSFPETEYFPKKKMICIGNPIRQELLDGNKEDAKEIFKLQGGKPLILVIGGSQGAQTINNLLLEILPELLEEFEIVHQIGEKNYQEIQTEAGIIIRDGQKPYYHPLPFLNENQLKHILAACDFVVSRAGAGTLFEIAAARKPALLIPLSSAAQDHQVKNAYAFVNNGGGEVLEEENLRPNFFLVRLRALFSRPDILQAMAENSGVFARPKAAQIIANYLVECSSLNQKTAKTQSSQSDSSAEDGSPF